MTQDGEGRWIVLYSPSHIFSSCICLQHLSLPLSDYDSLAWKVNEVGRWYLKESLQTILNELISQAFSITQSKLVFWHAERHWQPSHKLMKFCAQNLSQISFSNTLKFLCKKYYFADHIKFSRVDKKCSQKRVYKHFLTSSILADLKSWTKWDEYFVK